MRALWIARYSLLFFTVAIAFILATGVFASDYLSGDVALLLMALGAYANIGMVMAVVACVLIQFIILPLRRRGAAHG